MEENKEKLEATSAQEPSASADETATDVATEASAETSADVVEEAVADENAEADRAEEIEIEEEALEEATVEEEDSVEESSESGEASPEKVDAEMPDEETVTEVEESSVDETATEEADVPQEGTEEDDAAEIPSVAAPLPKSVLVIKPIHLAIAAGVMALLVAGGIVLGIMIGGANNGIDRDALDFEWVAPEGSDVDADGIILPGYPDLILPANARRVGLLLPNPSENPCHFRFTITLVETGEVLYQSGLIPPGMAVKEITLSRALKAGNYKAEIRIDTTSVTDGTPMNGGTMVVLLQVR